MSFNNPASPLHSGSISAQAGRVTGESEKDMLVCALTNACLQKADNTDVM